MLGWALREARWRLIVGLVLATTTPIWLPADPSLRLWALTAFALVAPWLVLGRDARRIAAGLREPLRGASTLGRLVGAELVPAMGVLVVGALVGTGAQPAAALALFAWGFFLVALADALDRRSARAGAAWIIVVTVALSIVTAPLWLAGWFNTAYGHWPATLAVGLHPAGAALVGAGRVTLQDPVFYIWTLSGVVEVRALGWWPGTALYLGLATIACFFSLRNARRPVAGFGAGARSIVS